MKKYLLMLVLASGLAVCTAPPSPAQDWSFMRGWNDEKRDTFTDSCVDALSQDPGIVAKFPLDKIGEACKCVTAYYEATYDYDTFRFMMDTENFNATESYKQEMFHISYQCAQWVLGAGQGT